MANISDHLSMVNLAPFGRCRSLGFPATASATAANHGSLTPMPCMHNTPFPWMGGKNDYIVKDDPALLKSCTCQCMWGGTINIVDNGQVDTGPANMIKVPIVDFNTVNKSIVSSNAELIKQYKSLMTNNNRLSSYEDLDRQLNLQFDILREYIKNEESKAKDDLKRNLLSRKGDSSETGYFRGHNDKRLSDVKWPNPYFEVGSMEIVIIPPGTKIDRFSNENGEFFGNPNSPLETRCVPEGHDDYSEYHTYITREPLIAIKSKVAPGGFGQQGGAEQYELFFNSTRQHVPYFVRIVKSDNEEVFLPVKSATLNKENSVIETRIPKDNVRDLVEDGYLDQITFSSK